MVITDTMEIDGKEVPCHFSVEMLQDVEIQMRLLRQFRTTEITDEEIAIWKAISFGIDRTPSDEYDQSAEAVTWREILGCTGPGFRCPILTDPITQQEINEWGVEYEKLKNIDFEAVKKKYGLPRRNGPTKKTGTGYVVTLSIFPTTGQRNNGFEINAVGKSSVRHSTSRNEEPSRTR